MSLNTQSTTSDRFLPIKIHRRNFSILGIVKAKKLTFALSTHIVLTPHFPSLLCSQRCFKHLYGSLMTKYTKPQWYSKERKKTDEILLCWFSSLTQWFGRMYFKEASTCVYTGTTMKTIKHIKIVLIQHTQCNFLR